MADETTRLSQELSDLSWQTVLFIRWMLSSLLDAAFLAFWVLIQWTVDQYVIRRFDLSGVDKYVYLVAQVLFAVSTLAPILFYIVGDIAIMWIRTKRTIQQEREKPRIVEVRSQE